MSTFSVYDIKEVISRVNEIFESKFTFIIWDLINIKYIFLEYVKDKVSEKLLSHELVEEEMAKPEYGDKTKKHLKQVSSILGFLNEYKMLAKARTCYIEFGAGRGIYKKCQI